MNRLFDTAAALLILAFVLLGVPSESFPQSVKSELAGNWQVMLPSQSNNAESGLMPVTKSANKNEWKTFFKRNGKWQLSIDKVTGTPRLAFGEPIVISGFGSVNESNISEAAAAFLKDNAGLFKINADDLELSRKDFVNGKWYVSFKQYYKGIEVLLAKIELRINSKGRVFSFDIEYYNDIDINVNPSITPSAAMEFAGAGMETKSKVNKTMESEKTYILPVKYSRKTEFKLVYKVNIIPESHKADYTAYINAHNGDVVWRFDKIMKAGVSVKGTVKVNSPNGDVTTEPMPYIYVKIGNKKYTADESGIIHCDIQEAADVSSYLEGPWAEVITEGINRGGFSGKILPGTDFSILFDDNNTIRYERAQYYYVNYIRKFLKNLDPQLTCIDTHIVVKLSYTTDIYMGDSPNAYSKGDTIGFINCQNKKGRLADGPSVLFHEYGHSVNTMFYRAKGTEWGMINITCHEALADLTAAALLDEYKVGVGSFTDDTLKYIRNLKNNMIFPDSINGECHHDSQILSGAMWDLREKTSLELLQKLHHYARYGLPDDLNNNIAFNKWLIEVLIADDDDGNLANRTPHYNEILESFNNHKIGTILFYTNDFEHDPIDDTPITQEPFRVIFGFGDDNTALHLPETVTLTYRIIQNNKVAETRVVPAIKAGSGEMSYCAEIPAQKAPALVQYLINLNFTNPVYSFSIGEHLTTKPYIFLVGYDTVKYDNFETDNKWVAGDFEDDATKGIWERGTPVKIDLGEYGGGIIKPGENHTIGGNMYYSTGLSGVPEERKNDMDYLSILLVPDGSTTLTSPVYDLSSLNHAVFQYYSYFRQNFVSDLAYLLTPRLTTEISNDGGNSWKLFDIDLSTGTENWEKKQFNFEDILPLTSKCRIRFRFQNFTGLMGTPIAMSSATIDDFAILAPAKINDAEEHTEINTISISPNPFVYSVLILFNDASGLNSKLSVYDLRGELVFSDSFQGNNSPVKSYRWSGLDLNNNLVPSGVYIYKISTGHRVMAGKLVKQ